MFYPTTDADAGKALAVCARCPVRAVCEQHALATGEEYGVWGGRTETERARGSAVPLIVSVGVPSVLGVNDWVWPVSVADVSLFDLYRSLFTNRSP